MRMINMDYQQKNWLFILAAF